MKRKSFILAISLISILLIATSTYANYTYEQTARSSFTASSLNVELIELQDDGEKQTQADSNVDIMPGTSISRIVKVRNIDKEDAWIRICLTLNDDIMADDGTIRLNDLNTSDWTYKDGSYYYNKVLKSGETTSELFSGLTFSSNLSTANEKLNFKIEAQATQSKYNSNSSTDAKGWPN